MIDNDGDFLQIVGSGKEEISKFQSVLEKAFAGKIKVDVDSRGVVTLTGDASKLEGREKVLYDKFYAITRQDVKEGTLIKLAGSDERSDVSVGSFRAAEVNLPSKTISFNSIDIYDIESVGKTDGTSPEGFLLHEVEETYFDQKNGNPKGGFTKAHEEAFKAQSELEGVTIIDNIGDKGLSKTGTGKSYLYYQKGDKVGVSVVTYEKGNVKETREGSIDDFKALASLIKERQQDENNKKSDTKKKD